MAAEAAPPLPEPDDDRTSQPPAGASGRKTDQTLVTALYQRADKMETMLNTAVENGLFIGQKPEPGTHTVKPEEVLEPITRAITILLSAPVTPQDYSKAIFLVDSAQYKYDQVIASIGHWRRLLYLYGLPWLVYLLVVLAIDVWLSLSAIPSLGTQSFVSIPLQILVAGSVGAVLKGITALWSNVDELTYRKIWATWFALSPFTGALLGGIVYLGFYVGVVVTTSGAAVTNPALPSLVALIAGYNWKWADNIISSIEKLFTTSDKSG